MTSDQKNFISISKEKVGNVTFEDNGSTKIISKGTVSLVNGKGKSQNVIYVEGLKHNHLSVGKICNQGHDLIFRSKYYEIRRSCSRKFLGRGVKITDNLYILI